MRSRRGNWCRKGNWSRGNRCGGGGCGTRGDLEGAAGSRWLGGLTCTQGLETLVLGTKVIQLRGRRCSMTSTNNDVIAGVSRAAGRAKLLTTSVFDPPRVASRATVEVAPVGGKAGCPAGLAVVAPPHGGGVALGACGGAVGTARGGSSDPVGPWRMVGEGKEFSVGHEALITAGWLQGVLKRGRRRLGRQGDREGGAGGQTIAMESALNETFRQHQGV